MAAVFFLTGCDFRCPYCQNARLVLAEGDPTGLITLEDALAFLERRRGLVSGLVLSGGEPLLRPELPGILALGRELGFALKLDTNGSHPDILAGLMEESSSRPDYIALDLKTVPRLYGRVAPAGEAAGKAVAESLGLIRASGIPFELRMTAAPGILGLAEAEELASLLEAEDAVVVQAFRPGGCLDPSWDEAPPTSESELRELLKVFRVRVPGARIRGSRI